MSLAIARGFDRMRLAPAADRLAIGVAVSMPWSTSASAILTAIWLVVLIPTLDLAALRREITTPAGGLPVALFGLGALGMLWADVSFAERVAGLNPFFKLLVIPLLFVQFRRSERGLWVLAGYLFSCTTLLALSSIFALRPGLTIFELHPGRTFISLRIFGVPVKNAATQSGEFVTCIFALLFIAFDLFRMGLRLVAFASLTLAVGFFANIIYVAMGRTALVVTVALFVLFGFKKFSMKGVTGLFIMGALLAAAAWNSSPYLRDRTTAAWQEVHLYRTENKQNSSGERLEFWKKSLGFIADAPVLGHGTGSIHDLFIRSASDQTGASATATTNPHNQTFAVAIQTGLLGAAMLWAMWIAHMFLFRGDGLAAWIGLLVVTQNVVGSLLNSHLFDAAQGWVYVFGVGVAGGLVARMRDNELVTHVASAAPMQDR